MAKSANLNIRIDPETKQSAESLYRNFGITVSDAVNIFLRQSLMVGGLPFEMRQPRYNAITEAAMQEANDIVAGRIKAKSYNSVAEMNADIDAMPDEDWPMLELYPTTQYKKDRKKAEKRGLPMDELDEVIETLRKEEPLDPKYRDHALEGNYAGLAIYISGGTWKAHPGCRTHGDSFRPVLTTLSRNPIGLYVICGTTEGGRPYGFGFNIQYSTFNIAAVTPRRVWAFVRASG